MSFGPIPPSTVLVGPDGRVTRDWWLFLQELYSRVGGASGASTSDLSESLFEDAGTGEVVAQIADVMRVASVQPPYEPVVVDLLLNELNAVRDQLAESLKPTLSIGPSL